jgi:hypothetical protein
MQKSWYVVLVAIALMFLGTGPLAAQTPASFYLNSAGSGANLAGVYTSPYTAQINGYPTINVICDDFSDDSYVPETWNANVTSLSTLASGTQTDLKWLNTAGSFINVDGYSLNQAEAYTVAALLSYDILENSGPTQVQAQEDYSFALWGLFDPGTSSDPGAFTQLISAGDNTDAINAVADLNSAVNYVETHNLGPGSYPNVTIYSYDTNDNPNGPLCGTGACPNSPPQEFIVVNMAEPPSPALLGLDLLAVAGLILFVRRRCIGSV